MIEAVISNANIDISRMMKKLGVDCRPKSSDPKALILGGGPDVCAELYWKKKHTFSNYEDAERDLKEISMINEARILGIPIIGICRGFQMMHVAFGGQLIQHVDGHRGGSHQLLEAANRKHTGMMVNSTHHQAVPLAEAERLYTEIYVAKEEGSGPKKIFAEFGFSPLRKILGVQFHPERDSCSKQAREIVMDRIEKLLTKG